MSNGFHRTLTNFKTELAGGGARPNLFEVSITNWAGGINAGSGDKGYGRWTNDDKSKFNFLCKAAALPASTLGVVEVPFRGRVFKVTGDKTFDTWTVTIINDEDFQLRTAFERWVNGMNKLSDGSGATNPSSYMGDAFVKQLSRGYRNWDKTIGGSTRNTQDPNNSGGDTGAAGSAKSLRTYFLHDIWPSNVSAIDLSYDTTDTVEEFQVEFQVQWMSIGSDQANGVNGVDQTGTVII